MCDNVPEALDRAPVWCILPDRNMRTPPIIIGGEFRKNPPNEYDTVDGVKAHRWRLDRRYKIEVGRKFMTRNKFEEWAKRQK